MTISITDLIILAALWLAVVVCGFLFGWHAGRYFRDPEEVDAAVRRHPAGNMARVAMSDTSFHRDDLRFRALTEDDDRTSIDIARHWHVLEHEVNPDTAPMSRAEVQISNWEAKIARDNRAWMHKHGVPGELRRDPWPARATRHAR